jgi:hypothetical protein
VVDLLRLLRDELLAHAPTDRDRDTLVFGTSRGAKQSPSNARNRVLAPAVELANVELAKHDLEPLPEGLTRIRCAGRSPASSSRSAPTRP